MAGRCDIVILNDYLNDMEGVEKLDTSSQGVLGVEIQGVVSEEAVKVDEIVANG